MNDLITYSAELATVQAIGKNYKVQCGSAGIASLKRDVDFGVIPKTKQPSLFKSGAEKICMGYGLLQQYRIESKIENPDPKNPVFYYLIECRLVKVVNGIEYVFSSAFGSANTSEKRNGFNSPWDSANATIKMAQKRALVAAALAISGLSDAFTQDMENETFMQNAAKLIDTDTPESPISTQQIKRLYAIGGELGMTAPEVKQLLAAEGITSTKQILQKDYNRIIDIVKAKGEQK